MSFLRMYSYLLNGHGLEIEINSKRSLLQSLWNRSRDCGSGELLNGDGTWLEMFFLGGDGSLFSNHILEPSHYSTHLMGSLNLCHDMFQDIILASSHSQTD